MSGHIFFIREKDHPFSIGRNMRKPVVVIVGEDLLLIAAVGLHTPDLHVSGALGVEIDVLTIGRIFGAVVKSLCGCKTSFITASYGNRVDIKVAIALADEGESLAIRRPAVPVRGSVLGDAARA